MEQLRQQGIPTGVPLSLGRTAKVRDLPEGLSARLDPPQFTGGGSLRLPAGTTITLPDGQKVPFAAGALAAAARYLLPAGTSFDIPFDAQSAGGAFPVPRPLSDAQLAGRTGAGNGTAIARAVPVSTEITDMPTRVRKGEPVLVGGYVSELATGRAVAGAPVDVFMNESKRLPGTLVGQGVTDANGRFSITLELPEDKPAASYQLVNHAVAFVDASGKAYADGWGDPPFATYASTSLSLSVPSVDGLGSRTPISGTLKDHTGAAVAGVTITILVDGSPVAYPVTTVLGSYSTSHVFPAGSHSVTARFLGNGNYDPSTAGPADITISNYALDVAPALYTRPGQTLTLTGRVLDQSTGLSNREVTIANMPFGETLLTTRTDATGRFTLQLAVPEDQRAGVTSLRYGVRELGLDKPQSLEVNQSGRMTLSAPSSADVEMPVQVELGLLTNGTPGRPLAGQAVRLTLTGPGGTSETLVTTGPDGEVVGAVAPLRKANGTYTLTARVVAPPNLQVGAVTTSVALGAFDVVWEAPGAVTRGEPATFSGTARFAGRPYTGAGTVHVLDTTRAVTMDAQGRFTVATTVPKTTPVGPANVTLASAGHPDRSFPFTVVAAPKLEIEAPGAFEAGVPPEVALRLVDDVGDPIRGSYVTLTAVSPRGTERTVVRTDDEGRWSGPVNLTAEVGDNVTMSARFDATGPYFSADSTRTMSATAPVVKEPLSPLVWAIPLAVVALAGAGGAAWYLLRKRAATRHVPVVAATPVVAAPVLRAADFDVSFGIPADEPAVWGVGEPLELTLRDRGAGGEIELAWPGGSKRVALAAGGIARTTMTFPQEGDLAITARRASASDVEPVSATVRIVDYPKETAREFDVFLEKAKNLDARIGRKSTPREIQWTLAEHLGGEAERRLEEIALAMEITNYSNDATKRTRSHYLRFVRASRALDPFFAPRAIPAPPPPPPRHG